LHAVQELSVLIENLIANRKDAFSYYDPETHAWKTEPGDFEILAGSSSTDIRQKLIITLKDE